MKHWIRLSKKFWYKLTLCPNPERQGVKSILTLQNPVILGFASRKEVEGEDGL